MNTNRLYQTLENMLTVLPALLHGISNEQAQWKPPSGNWSLTEIVCHLAHEELHDFRARLKSTLIDPSHPWDPIAPEKTVIAEGFNRRTLAEAIQWFLSERTASLAWLKQTISQTTDWELAYEHPDIGRMRAGDMFASWVTHDQLHIRQIAKRLIEITTRFDATGFSVKYAGDLPV